MKFPASKLVFVSSFRSDLGSAAMPNKLRSTFKPGLLSNVSHFERQLWLRDITNHIRSHEQPHVPLHIWTWFKFEGL